MREVWEVSSEAPANDEWLPHLAGQPSPRPGMYRLTPPVVARGAPQLTCPRYGSEARGVVQACSA